MSIPSGVLERYSATIIRPIRIDLFPSKFKIDFFPSEYYFHCFPLFILSSTWEWCAAGKLGLLGITSSRPSSILVTSLCSFQHATTVLGRYYMIYWGWLLSFWVVSWLLNHVHSAFWAVSIGQSVSPEPGWRWMVVCCPIRSYSKVARQVSIKDDNRQHSVVWFRLFWNLPLTSEWRAVPHRPPPEYTVRTWIDEPCARTLELLLLVRPNIFFFLFCLRGQIFSVFFTPFQEEEISDYIAQGSFIRVLTVS